MTTPRTPGHFNILINNKFSMAGVSPVAAVNNTAALPASYREALCTLVTADDSRPPLPTLSDTLVLDLAKEIRSTLYDSMDEWGGDDWTRNEAQLLKLGGSAAEGNMTSNPYVIVNFVGDYLCTFIEALEWKLKKSNGTSVTEKQMPELLSKKRKVDNTEVYGPVNLSASLPGNTFEVWTSPVEARKDNNNTESEIIGQVAVVLGAGNQSFLTLIDIIDNTLRRRRPVLVKHHPLRPWLSEPYGIILAPLARRGYFAQVVDVGITATKALLLDPAVGHVHITGALKTAMAVRDLLQKAHPQLSHNQISSMVTSELGCATPMILDDGIYSDLELQHAAQIIVTGKKFNGGCNCLSAQVIVLPKHWKQKEIFRSKLLEELERQPTAPCYYPGSVERNAIMVQQCQEFGTKCTTVVAPSVSEETEVSDEDQVVVVECGTPGEEGYNAVPLLLEAFGPVLAIVELDNGKNDDYLTNIAVPFLNDKGNIFGSLSCSIFTPISKGKAYDHSKGLQSALAALQYGSIAVNQWNIFGYVTAMKGGTWGGHPLEALGQSGNGLVGDQYGLLIGNKIEKCILYGPSLENTPAELG